MHHQPTVIALGFFDGVHRGHGALLRRTAERAAQLGVTPAVFTFDRPPKEVVKGQPIPLINSAEDRLDLIGRLYAIDRIILAPFDHAMMTMCWQDFIAMLAAQYGAIHLIAGHDYRFGHKNQGTPELLRSRCAQLGLGCDIVPRVTHDGVTVSSTRIRTLLEAGDVEQAADFLGHPHCLGQIVTHGQHIGRTIGVPTINFSPPASVLTPRHGVYVTQANLPDGTNHPGITNVGIRPTVGQSTAVSVETFLLDYSGNLYGQHIRLDFCRRLRDERYFDSLNLLKEQILRDIDSARAYFSQS